MAAKKLIGADVIANQVFVGVPWRTVRPRYETIIGSLRTKSPLSFVIIGRDGQQDAEDLFEVIKERIGSSSPAATRPRSTSAGTWTQHERAGRDLGRVEKTIATGSTDRLFLGGSSLRHSHLTRPARRATPLRFDPRHHHEVDCQHD